MHTRLGRTVILVEDYDKAFAFYETNFGCRKIFESTLPDGQRYLHVAFTNDTETGIWFLQADTPEQKSKIGNQTGGQPTLVIYTSYIERLFKHVRKKRSEHYWRTHFFTRQ